MLKTIPHSEQIFYVGADDKTLDLFESQYPVPDGVSYNAYVIRDEKTALLDTVDPRATNQWLEQVTEVLDGTAPDYLVISHMEPDHAGSIRAITEHYPDMTLVGSAVPGRYAGQSHPYRQRGRDAGTGQPHPALRHGTHGTLAGSHGVL